MTIRFSPLVRDALDNGYPVVALETSLVTHALPHSRNLEATLAAQEQLLAGGVIPATMGVVGGDAVVGLSDDELAQLADDRSARRVSIRDLPIVETKGLNGGASLAATMHLAHRAGIQVCATTGLGGVHRASAWTNPLQESSDLTALSGHPVVLVASGVRPMLDLPATLERLETLSVPVLGYRTNGFPGFYVADSGYPVDYRVETPGEIADIARARDELGLQQALLVANPISSELEVRDYEERLGEAAEIAARYAAGGEDDTQVLLVSLEEATGGEIWQANTEIYRRNVSLAAQVAKALATTPRYTD
ncbi:pseudouridine-5'-phosphate glycosidase [Brooklawnia cerclae]|uniref:Pseudouridine-5'-phosphate glycosidase n=1 Tax=Brooklawnia cerclae TaxID=349934 RepID=A0ABX0SCR1_9ACTN|nr:pseudouridine-5'-phosphate glycosidase [Brooklawnia cerclae]